MTDVRTKLIPGPAGQSRPWVRLEVTHGQEEAQEGEAKDLEEEAPAPDEEGDVSEEEEGEETSPVIDSEWVRLPNP